MKTIFSIILIGLTILVAFQVYALVSPVTDTPGAQLSPDSTQINHDQPKSKADRLAPVKLKKVIERVTQRNLFKVAVDGKNNKAPEPENRHLEKTSLKLTLWGTVTGEQKQDNWAVIEDLKKRQQDLYQVNDKIQGAAIKSILRNKVVLTVNGKDQILEVNAEPLPSQDRKRGSSGPPPKHPRQHNIPDRQDMLDTVSQSHPLFKTRPYVKNGEAAGVMIYSIKKDSAARRLGLRNGDIVLAFDDVEIQDPQDFENFDDSIDDHSDITISILRRGKSKKLVFSGQDNAYTINDIEQ